MKYFCRGHYSNLEHFDMVFTSGKILLAQAILLPHYDILYRFCCNETEWTDLLDKTKFEILACFYFMLNIWHVPIPQVTHKAEVSHSF